MAQAKKKVTGFSKKAAKELNKKMGKPVSKRFGKAVMTPDPKKLGRNTGYATVTATVLPKRKEVKVKKAPSKQARRSQRKAKRY